MGVDEWRKSQENASDSGSSDTPDVDRIKKKRNKYKHKVNSKIKPFAI